MGPPIPEDTSAPATSSADGLDEPHVSATLAPGQGLSFARKRNSHSGTSASGASLSKAQLGDLAYPPGSRVTSFIASFSTQGAGDTAQAAQNHTGQLPDHCGEDELPLTANRNGTWQSCMFHNVTAMVGAGVLGLPSTFIYLGWYGGNIVLVAALFISWYTFILLVKMHEVAASDDPEKTHTTKYMRLNRYIELSNYAFGERWGWVIQPFQIGLLWGTAITYTVTGAVSLKAVYNNAGGTEISQSVWIVIFSSVSLLVSQIKDFGGLMLVSAMGACVTAFYSSIAVGMSASYPYEPRAAVSYATGHGNTPVGVMFGTFNALTTVMFAFGGHNIALEIQASLPGGTCAEDSTVPRMMVGVHVAFIFACVVYFSVACVGWWAYGSFVAGNVIFSLGGPVWVRSLADMLVVMHVIASFQVYSFPLHDMMEGQALHWGIRINWWRRIILRSTYVLVTGFIACLLPFFSDLMGLVGALGITPTTFVFPCLLWLKLMRPSWRTFDFWACWFIAISITIVGVLGTIGSMRQIIVDSSTFKVFA